MLGCPGVPQGDIRVPEGAGGDVGVLRGMLRCPGVTQEDIGVLRVQE